MTEPADIVELLRSYRGSDDGVTLVYVVNLRKAADEIERLRAALREYLRDFGDNEDSDSQLMAAKTRAVLEGK